MKFTTQDKKFMKLSLKEAEKSLNNKDFPVGAVLVIDGKLVDKKRNTLHNDKDWTSHAESLIIKENSKIIRDKIKNNNSKVELYTTLEPCLMCLGTAVLNRISKIVYACPDPHGGATHLNPKNLTKWYERKWPEIKCGLFKEKSYELLVNFMKEKNDETWNKILKLYEEMHVKW